MARRKSFWQRLATELIWLPFTLGFILLAAWFCLFVLPGILTGIWLDIFDLPKP